jgi:hypothetical protein
MTDEATETQESIPLKTRRGGWPKGKPRVSMAAIKAKADAAEPKAMLSKMKARPNWESEDFVGVGMDEVDRLKIPSEIIDSLYRDGIALQWITKSVRGQETPQEMSKFTRGGWTPVHQSDFDGALNGMFMPKGRDDVITVDDCLLVARPAEIQAKSKMSERRQANSRVKIVEDQMGRGIPNVTGSDHPTATRGNHINKTFERIEIPD